MTDVLNVVVRQQLGTHRVRRLRKTGQTPAVLYGHGEESVSLAIPTSEIETALRHGSKLVDLKGGVIHKALVRAIQWDTFGTHVLHVDLARVSDTERVTIKVPLELRGESRGFKAGGIVEQSLHELEIECTVSDILDRVYLSVRDLDIGETITAGNIELPDRIALVTPADTLVVSCHAASPEADVEEAAAQPGPSEPEVIGRKAEDDEEAE